VLETESTFVSVEEEIRWKQAMSDIRLRGILVWFTIVSFAVEMLYVLLHSSGSITLPSDVVKAIAVHMGGSGIGLVLTYIVKDLFKGR
jgi:hypothetical protein